ncbi:Transcription factor GRAS [Arabidopsis suecica]|uniref:Transcription factor GRAS n=1 Tax=Arabidopsis suecica TaxID=45249 RepID=A0A8T1XDD3_ARASU|nr:Transcription factor GRAS [Arabidopsis suecica]KAG7566272.1 Transcription factor GRAS [Arabidopsis suecica]
MPLPFEQFQGKGVLGFLDSSSSPGYKIWANPEKLHGRVDEDLCFIVNNGGFSEPTSVLDSVRSPSPFVSSSTTTLSSSHGGPSGGGAAAATFSGADGKCDPMGFEDLDGVLSGGSPGQEQSIFRLIMAGDVVDPGSEFVGFDTGSGSDPVIDNPNPLFGYGFPFHDAPEEEKFHISTNPEALINPNPSFFSDPPSFPPAKRLNSGQPGSQHHHQQWGFPFSDPGHESHDPFLTPPKIAGEDPDDQDQSTVIIDQLFSAAAELTTNGGDNNPVLAQGILARLNHNLNNNDTNNNPKPPFHRAASYITEALHTLLQDSSSPPSLSPPQNLIFRIAAYRAFSETSPFLQFVNFTANQTILESFEGFDRIHIVDFDIGYGGQWASLIQELAGKRSRSSSPPSLKITAFASPSTVSDEFELRFTEENLRSFAGETGVSFEIELLNMEILLNPTYWPLSLVRSSAKEAIAVNLPISSIVSGYLPLILRFLKQISPNVVVCSDRSCDRNNDAPFPNGVINALQYYTSLLESLDSGNLNNAEAASSIERFCVQPSIQKLLTNRYRWMERSPPWRSLFGQCGFSPVTLSQTAETQAEYLLQRNPMRGFHLEKRQSSSSSLVLYWQRKELVTVSAWKC